MHSRLFPVIATLFLFPAWALAAPVTIGNPPAPPIATPSGQGLCEAAAESIAPAADFGTLNVGNYISAINTFIDGRKDGPQARTEKVVDTVLDLSNNNDAGQQVSYGDFVDAQLPDCKTGGCDFAIGNDTTTSFASRLRGYFNVTADMVNQPIHFGIFSDDATSLNLFDKNGNTYTVLIQPPQLGAPTWRMTETVTFTQEGLYPMEVLYVEITADAALEISYLVGDFEDFQQVYNQNPRPLDDAGFTLFPPTAFFQAVSGAPYKADAPGECEQCNRQFVNLPGNGGCKNQGFYCNEAALCAPCDTALFCGPTCSPCGGGTPFCFNTNGQNECVECRDDRDCPNGFACDPNTNTCQECNVDADCGQGESCVDHSCVPCNTDDACAGNSCNCCPAGPSGAAMQCADVDGAGTFACVECTQNADCASGVCDVLVGHCVDKLATNERPDCCGDDCLECPEGFPYCLPGPFGTACAECRWDTDCDAGNFCLSGQCLPCTTDRHCGERCTTCGGDTPYCDGQVPAVAQCVRCTDDSQCDGGTCNTATHECEAGECTMSCGDATPYCYGQACVECYADTQCPCGGTCNLDTLTCSASCKSNADCLGTQHCRWDEKGADKECALGPMPGDAACGSTVTCTISPGRAGRAPLAGMMVLLLLGLAALRRRRAAGGRGAR